jgi:hypothetical protein
MNIHELIETLQDLEEWYPDADVRLALQPNWPFEHSIGNVIAVDINKDEDDVDDEEKDESSEEDEESEENSNVVIYIGESEQLGYLPHVVKVELGW